MQGHNAALENVEGSHAGEILYSMSPNERNVAGIIEEDSMGEDEEDFNYLQINIDNLSEDSDINDLNDKGLDMKKYYYAAHNKEQLTKQNS